MGVGQCFPLLAAVLPVKALSDTRLAKRGIVFSLKITRGEGRGVSSVHLGKWQK